MTQSTPTTVLVGARRLLRPSVLFFLGLFLLYAAVSQEGRAGYEFENYMTAESIVERGSMQFVWPADAAPKLIYPRHGILQPLLEAPLYWAAREIGFAPSSLLDTQTSLRSRGFAVSLFLPIMGALTGLLLLDLGKRLFAPRTAWLIALLAATATMLFPYAALGMELFLTATMTASVYFLFRLKESGRLLFAALAGMAMGALLNSKGYAGAFLVVLGAYALYVVWLQRQRTPQQKIALLATMALAFLPFFALYAWFGVVRDGNWLHLPSATIYMRMATTVQDWYGYLFAPGKSIFLYNPPLLLLPFALAPMYRRFRAETMLLAGLVATLMLLFAGTWAAFPDEVWGPRYWTPLVQLLMLCCGPAVDRLLTSHRGKTLLLAIFASGLYVQILGVTFQYAIPIRIAQTGGAANTPEMYFVPQYSSLYINSLNLVSGLRRTFGLPSLTYRTTLLRSIPGTGDTPVHGPEVKLGDGYDRLDLLLFHWPGRLRLWPLSSDRFLVFLYALLFCAPSASLFSFSLDASHSHPVYCLRTESAWQPTLRRTQHGMSNNPSIPSLGSAISRFSSKWRHGYLLESLVAREVKVRYRRSVLGVLWTLLNPIMMMAIFTVVFSTLFAGSLKDFPIYFLAANLSWHFFAGGSNLAMTSMVRNSGLYKRIYVPKYIFVLAAVLSETVNFMISLLPLAALILIYRHPVTPAILFLPVAFVILLIFTTGVSFIVATIAVFFDDITQFYQVILQALMYLTALFYPLSIVPKSWRVLIEFNPLYHLIQLIREPIYDGKMPALESIAFATGTALVALAIGWLLFSRNSDRFVYYV